MRLSYTDLTFNNTLFFNSWRTLSKKLYIFRYFDIKVTNYNIGK